MLAPRQAACSVKLAGGVAAAIVVLAVRQADAPAAITVAMAAAAFVLVWAALVSWERHTLDPLARTRPRFPPRHTTAEQPVKRRTAWAGSKTLDLLRSQ